MYHVLTLDTLTPELILWYEIDSFMFWQVCTSSTTTYDCVSYTLGHDYIHIRASNSTHRVSKL
jgi:hypothetical protein